MDGPIPCHPRPGPVLFRRCDDSVRSALFRPRARVASIPTAGAMSIRGDHGFRLHRPSPTILHAHPQQISRRSGSVVAAHSPMRSGSVNRDKTSAQREPRHLVEAAIWIGSCGFALPRVLHDATFRKRCSPMGHRPCLLCVDPYSGRSLSNSAIARHSAAARTNLRGSPAIS